MERRRGKLIDSPGGKKQISQMGLACFEPVLPGIDRHGLAQIDEHGVKAISQHAQFMTLPDLDPLIKIAFRREPDPICQEKNRPHHSPGKKQGQNQNHESCYHKKHNNKPAQPASRSKGLLSFHFNNNSQITPPLPRYCHGDPEPAYRGDRYKEKLYEF